MHIKVGDMVRVITGNDRGSNGKVLKVNRAGGKLVVEGMNRVWKHVRRSQRNPQGGRLHTEMPLPISNVMLICPKCGRPSRTGSRPVEGGGKERFCKKCSAGIGLIGPAKTTTKS